MRTVAVFGHIPKTGGTTMRRILHRHYGSRRTGVISMETFAADLGQLQQRQDSQQEPLDLIISHTGYGVHERLPKLPEPRHFTLLREPVKRVLSAFSFLQRKELVRSELSLEEFLRTDPRPSYNTQTAFLSGYLCRVFEKGEAVVLEHYTEGMLDAAKQHLAGHVVVGLTERFDESLLLMHKAFGWDWYSLFYSKLNVSPKPKGPQEISVETRGLIEAHNRLDIVLYEFARERFTAQLQKEGRWISKRLPAFRLANRMNANRILRPFIRPILRGFRKLLRH